ncbi:anthocyanin regulatory R-S protein-like isoform X2 [Phragmites australis]|nr:anthocyanin regulatory R-S protein-like isoform X2 [Phragmites australis]XP_062183703.1 anthocyanin regulatory R-S protein-like isoform X2 [Phragmites australis]
MAPSALVQEKPQPVKHLRNQLAAAVRSINWSYAIFWSISSSHQGVLTWKDGFYNGEVKTRKISNSMELTADQLVLQRSEQLRELYESLLSGKCDHRAARPEAFLSPEDLGDTEWYYVVCMTYAFRPGQGLPGKSFASNEHVWLCNAHLADGKTFPRALLVKSASIQTIVCIPLMSGVLELGTTASVPEDPDLVNRTTTSFNELQFPACTVDPSENQTVDANNVIVLPDDLDQNAMETIIAEGRELGEVDCLYSANNLEQIAMEIDDFSSIWDELDMQPLEDSWIMDGSSLVAAAAAEATPGDSSRVTSFMAWTRSDSDELAVAVIGEPQKLLKKVVAGGAWTNNGGERTAKTTQESGIKNHVMSERRRREKMNEMFLILKSLVPSIHKVDKVSILEETIAYLKELEQRVQELESRREPISHPGETTRLRRHDNEITVKRVSARAKTKKALELSGTDMEREHHWVLSKDGTSNVNVTVIGMEVLLEVHCRWKELLMTRFFDAFKGLHLDVLSVQASTTNGLLGLKIQAQFASSTGFAPGMIREALQKAISTS